MFSVVDGEAGEESSDESVSSTPPWLVSSTDVNRDVASTDLGEETATTGGDQEDSSTEASPLLEDDGERSTATTGDDQEDSSTEASPLLEDDAESSTAEDDVAYGEDVDAEGGGAPDVVAEEEGHGGIEIPGEC